MDQPFAMQAFTDTGLIERCDAAGFENACTYAPLDVLAAARLQNDRFDSRAIEKVCE